MTIEVSKKIMSNALGFVGFYKKGYFTKVDRSV